MNPILPHTAQVDLDDQARTKELLARCAKAANLLYDPEHGLASKDGLAWEPWNPLEDDDQAQALAITFGLEMALFAKVRALIGPDQYMMLEACVTGRDQLEVTRTLLVYGTIQLAEEKRQGALS